ncbi:MAG TPA: glycosyltransferase [Caulobacteraceae bacterium]|nr:glycosyltransferase [Caulobacteraceae bacterium]
MAELSVMTSTYPAAHLSRGGVHQQILRTEAGLRARFPDVRVRGFDPLDWADVDVLHVFSLDPSQLAVAKAFKAKGKKVVVTPIFMSVFESEKRLALYRRGMKLPGVFSFFKSARGLLEAADGVIAMIRAEADGLERLFPGAARRIRVIPNMGFPDVLPPVRSDPGEHLLYVGVIEPRKNLRGAIALAKAAKVPLKVCGTPVPGQEAYAELCRKEAGPETEFLGFVPGGSDRLADLYARSLACVLLSRREAAPLIIREAALQGRVTIVPAAMPNQDDFEPFLVRTPEKGTPDPAAVLAEAARVSASAALLRQAAPTDARIAEAHLDEYRRVLDGR